MTKRKPPELKLKAGRPTDYTPELGARICELIATNTAAIKTLCALHDELPDECTVFRWLGKYPEFRQGYLTAKESQGLQYAEKLLLDAENCVAESAEIAKQNHIFRVAQWHYSKLAPKTFGDKKDKDDEKSATSAEVQEVAEAIKKLNAKHEKDY